MVVVLVNGQWLFYTHFYTPQCPAKCEGAHYMRFELTQVTHIPVEVTPVPGLWGVQKHFLHEVIGSSCIATDLSLSQLLYFYKLPPHHKSFFPRQISQNHNSTVFSLPSPPHPNFLTFSFISVLLLLFIAQSCPTLCNFMDCNLPLHMSMGFPRHL